MSLKDKIAKQVQEAAAKADADTLAAREAMKALDAKRELDALSAAVALLEDSNIEEMVKTALTRPALGTKVGFALTKGTLQAMRIVGTGFSQFNGLAFEFPHSPDPMIFQKAVRQDVIQTRIADLKNEGVIVSFPNTQMGSPSIILIDFSGA